MNERSLPAPVPMRPPIESIDVAICSASLVVVPESGHLSTLEQPERVTQALHLWLNKD